MRKFLIVSAAAASALAVATPAAAQYYPAPAPGYGYDNGYNNGYNHGGVARWDSAVQRIYQDIRMLSQQGRLTSGEFRMLDYDTSVVRNAIRKYSYNGLTGREARDLDRRVSNLQYAVSKAANNRSTRYTESRYGRYDNYGYNNNGYGSGFPDRDRDGRDDRYENDHGYQRDY